jgi:hypothetical protein
MEYELKRPNTKYYTTKQLFRVLYGEDLEKHIDPRAVDKLIKCNECKGSGVFFKKV